MVLTSGASRRRERQSSPPRRTCCSKARSLLSLHTPSSLDSNSESRFWTVYHAPLHVAAMPLVDGGVELVRFVGDEQQPLVFSEVRGRPTERVRLHEPGRDAPAFQFVSWSSGATDTSLLAAARADGVEIWEVVCGDATCVWHGAACGVFAVARCRWCANAAFAQSTPRDSRDDHPDQAEHSRDDVEPCRRPAAGAELGCCLQVVVWDRGIGHL